MAVMSGKFHVWGDGVSVFMMHGRDITDVDGRHREELLVSSLGEEEGERAAELLRVPETPRALRTGVREPMSFWLPREVFLSLVVRVYEKMTPEQRDLFRGPTAWESEEQQGADLVSA